MSERNPNSNHENEADYSTFAGIAGDFFDRYVGDAVPAGTKDEDKDAWREQVRQDLAEKMANTSADLPLAERVAAYGEIIDELKKMHDEMGGSVVSEPASPKNDKDEQLSLMDKVQVYPSIWATRAFGYIQDRSEKSLQRRNESIQRREDEDDKAYEKRMRRHKIRTRLGSAAVTTAVVGGIIAAKFIPGVRDTLDGSDFGGSPNIFDGVDMPEGDLEALPDHEGGDTDPDVGEVDMGQTYEQSIQAEREFLETNGRTGNDFNYIDPNGSREDIIAELHDQYSKSPTELAGQLHQIQGIEDAPIELLPEELRLQDGETYDDYTARLSEALHRDPALHDSLVEYTVEYVDGNFKVIDMPNYYQAAYITETGDSYWDHHVTSADSNDKIIMLADGKGIRLPCGQPVEFTLGAPAGVGGGAPVGMGGAPVGMGGAPVHDTPGVHYTPPAQDTPGEGGPPPEEPPVRPPVTPPVTPPEGEPPVTPPEELDSKSEDPGAYKHKAEAPNAEFGGNGPAEQTETPIAVTEQTPGQEIDYDTPAAQAPGAEAITPEENQQRVDTPPATGATTPENVGQESSNPF